MGIRAMLCTMIMTTADRWSAPGRVAQSASAIDSRISRLSAATTVAANHRVPINEKVAVDLSTMLHSRVKALPVAYQYRREARRQTDQLAVL